MNQVDTNVAPASPSLSQDLLYVNFGSTSYVDGHRDSICNVRCQHDVTTTSMIVLLKREDVLSRTCLTVLYLTHSLFNTFISQNGPTSQRVNNNNAEQNEFFAEVTRLPSRYSSSAQFYIVGDVNSMTGYRKFDEGFMGQHSRGRRNVNGIAITGFLEGHGLYVCNTAFQHSARHKTTWQGQRRDAATGHIVPIYNVIDFVICRQTYKRLLTDSRSYGPHCAEIFGNVTRTTKAETMATEHVRRHPSRRAEASAQYDFARSAPESSG